MLKYSSLKLLIIGCLLCSTNVDAVPQGARKIDWPRMERDLKIMEGILNELLLSSSNMRVDFTSQGARGLYFEGYGVVFQVDLGNPHLLDLQRLELEAAMRKTRVEQEKAKQETESDEDELTVIDTRTGTIFSQLNLSMEKRLQGLKDQSLQFLGDYADAIGQLSPSDRITILIHLERNTRVFAVTPENFKKLTETPVGLEITAKKSDIVDYRKGSINSSTFHSRIAYRERLPSENRDKNIEIMANILNTALNRGHREEFVLGNRGRGIYLKGLGALFFMKGEAFSRDYNILMEEMLRDRSRTRVRATQSPAFENETREKLDSFKNEIVELVGDYGHTLRTLKPTEYVVVNVDFKQGWAFGASAPERLILKVQKQDLDRYDRGDLTKQQLREKVEFLEY